MFVQLKAMYGLVASIPMKVFLTGYLLHRIIMCSWFYFVVPPFCMIDTYLPYRSTILMAEGSGPDLRPIFEDFLAKWRYTDDQVYVLNGEHKDLQMVLLLHQLWQLKSIWRW